MHTRATSKVLVCDSLVTALTLMWVVFVWTFNVWLINEFLLCSAIMWVVRLTWVKFWRRLMERMSGLFCKWMIIGVLDHCSCLMKVFPFDVDGFLHSCTFIGFKWMSPVLQMEMHGWWATVLCHASWKQFSCLPNVQDRKLYNELYCIHNLAHTSTSYNLAILSLRWSHLCLFVDGFEVH